MPVLSDEARAKVNLTLRVNGRRADGFHDLESVVAFADCADRLTLTPGSDLNLKMSGPLAQACGETSDNLVLKAARLLAERVPDMKAGSFSLDKVLPVAAGLPCRIGMTSVVVEPTSINIAGCLPTNRAAKLARACQLAAATSSGSFAATCGVTSLPSTR